MGSARVHGSAIQPMGGGEPVVGHNPGAGGVEKQVNGHAEEYESQNGPSKEIESTDHRSFTFTFTFTFTFVKSGNATPVGTVTTNRPCSWPNLESVNNNMEK